MSMEYTVADVAQAMRDLMEAQSAERAGREGYDGGSWGYHGHFLITAVHDAEQRLQERLGAVIDARVAVAIDKAKEQT